jgi:DNA repair exonuclease SbcCD ATPase subunit
LEKQYLDCDARVGTLNSDLQKLDKAISDETAMAADKERRNAALENIEYCKQRAASIKLAEVSMNMGLSSAKQFVESLKAEAAQKSSTYDAEISEMTKKVASMKGDVEAAGFEYDARKDEAEAVEKSLEEKRDRLHAIDLDIVRADERLASMDRDKADYENTKNEATVLSKEMSRIMYMDKILANKVKNRAAQSCIPLVTHYINDFLSVLKSTIRIQFGGPSGFSINLVGGSAPVFELLSGGEKESVRLAANMALSMLAIGGAADIPDMIFLDEVFGQLDVNTKNNVFVLIDKLNRSFNRICIIAHDQTLNDRFPVSLLVNKVDGISNVKIMRKANDL